MDASTNSCVYSSGTSLLVSRRNSKKNNKCVEANKNKVEEIFLIDESASYVNIYLMNKLIPILLY